MAAQQFCLKWNNHTNNMLEIFNTLLSTEALVDVTLACDGLSLKAHKIVLSACSPFFQSLFLENPCQHPIVIMKDIPYKDLKAIVDFMYRGEVNVSQDQLSGLLRTAETLKVKGLADENRGVQQEVSTSQNSVVPPSTSTSTSQQRRADSPPLHAKRKKGRPRKRSLSDSNRSDDEMGPAKIKEPNSPEIEELSEDAILDEGRSDSMIRQRSSSSQRRIRSSVNTSFSSKSLTPSNAHIEEPPSGEEEFELEPSKLLEQTLTTDAASSVSNTALTSTMPVNFNLPSSSGIEISQIGSDSQALVPVAGTSDSSHLQGPDSPPDIKPTITTFDESQSDSMMYMDQSSLPGPSNYQDNSMMQGDEQPQEIFEKQLILLFPASINEFTGVARQEVVTSIEPSAMVDETAQAVASLEAVLSGKPSDEAVEIPEAVAFVTANQADVENQPSTSGIVIPACRTSKRNQPNASVALGCFIPKKRACEVCKEVFDSVELAKKHVCLLRMLKSGTRSLFKCSFCIYSSRSRSNVIRHVRTHTDERPFQCDVCGKKFRQKEAHKQHKRVHEESPRNFECAICDKKFGLRGSLKVHMNIHTDLRPHLCQFCPKTFTSASNLWHHERSHRGIRRQFKKIQTTQVNE